MLEIYARPFVAAQDVLVQWSVQCHSPGTQMSKYIAPEQSGDMGQIIGELLTQLTAPEFDSCRRGAERLLNLLAKGADPKNVVSAVDDLRRRILDATESLACFTLSRAERDLYNGSAAVTPVVTKLPTAAFDLDEGAKCLSFGRSTAAVFHLMRVMEIGVQKFGDKLGVMLVSEKNWQNILDQVNPPIKALGKAPEAAKYASIAAHLFNVKLAWRNEVMHPKATYTPEEANRIYQAVEAFMTDLVGVL